MKATSWEKVQLGEIIDLEYGTGLPENKRSGNGFPVYGSNGVVGQHKDFMVEGPGIIVGRKGTVGAVTWTDENFWPIDTTYFVKPKIKLDLKWCYLVLTSLNLNRLDSSTGVPGLNRADVYNLYVSIPPYNEQKVISNIIWELDRLIGRTHALIAKLKQIKAGLLHDLLTRGLDENGELRDPVAHPEQFKDSLLGRMPREWECRRLATITLKIADRDHSTPKYVDDGYIMVSPTNFIDEEGIDFTSCKRISPEDHYINKKKTDISPGDILLHRIGAGLGQVRMVTPQMPEFSILHSLAQIRPDPTKIIPQFLLFAFSSRIVQKQIEMGIQSIGVPDLGLDKISELLFPVPPLEEQTKIASVLEQVTTRIIKERTLLKKLNVLKHGLMHDLLTGKVRVPLDEEGE